MKKRNREERESGRAYAAERVFRVCISASLLFFILFAASLAAGADDANPPVILQKRPLGLTNENPVLFSMTTDELSTCRYDTQAKQYDDMGGIFAGNETGHNVSLSLADGPYTYFAACKDTNNNSGNPENVSFVLDTVPSVIREFSPVGTVFRRSVEFNVTTNEAATCRFDISDVIYENLASQFEQTGRLIHRQAYPNLAEGAYTYFVRCKDSAGNRNQESTRVSFAVNVRPTAVVAIENGDILQAGKYTVRLVVSEPLAETPSLRYNFNDDANLRTISLMGSGNSYSGYMIVGEELGDKIGTFFFQGIDETQLSGTEITGGKLFVIDTKKPKAPLSLEIENDKRGLQLSWYYDGETQDYYKIYRSASASVSYADYYVRSEESEFLDKDVEDGKTYHYRVSAVDVAGNEGDLSVERYLTATLAGQTKEESVQLSSTLTGTVRRKISGMDKSLLDIDASLTYISSLSDPAAVDVVVYFDLMQKVRSAKQAVSDIRAQAEGLLSLDLNAEELRLRMDKIDLALQKNLQNVVDKVEIMQKSDIQQVHDDSDVYTAIADAVQSSERLDQEYQKSMLEVNDRAKVGLNIVQVKITYLEGRSEVLTLVRKDVQADGTVAGRVIESIPKDVASSAKEVLSMQSYRTLKDDPVLEWPLSSGKAEVRYYFASAKDINRLKTTRTIVILSPEKQGINQTTANNSITGLAGKDVFASEAKGGFSLQQIIIFFGIIVVVGLVIYYFFFLKAEDKYEGRESGEEGLSSFIKHSGKETPERQVHAAKRSNPLRPPPAPVDGHQAKVVTAADVADRGDAGLEIEQPYVKTGREKTREEDVRRLVLDAKKLLDNLDVDGAYAYYVTVVDLYPHLGGVATDELAGDVQEVYSRLSLLGALGRCKGRAERMSPREVDILLLQIDGILAEKGAESRFTQYLRENQNHLLQYKITLNKPGVEKGISAGFEKTGRIR
jgi:hypothetical protein